MAQKRKLKSIMVNIYEGDQDLLDIFEYLKTRGISSNEIFNRGLLVTIKHLREKDEELRNLK